MRRAPEQALRAPRGVWSDGCSGRCRLAWFYPACGWDSLEFAQERGWHKSETAESWTAWQTGTTSGDVQGEYMGINRRCFRDGFSEQVPPRLCRGMFPRAVIFIYIFIFAKPTSALPLPMCGSPGPPAQRNVTHRGELWNETCPFRDVSGWAEDHRLSTEQIALRVFMVAMVRPGLRPTAAGANRRISLRVAAQPRCRRA